MTLILYLEQKKIKKGEEWKKSVIVSDVSSSFYSLYIELWQEYLVI